MKRFKIPRLSRLAVTGAIAISTLLLCGLILLALPTMGQPQAKVFDEVWKTAQDKFYDPNMNGVNWQAVRSKYQPQARQAQSSEAVAAVINQMLSELKTSHTRFYTPDEPAYYQILGIFQPRNPDLQKQLRKFFPSGKIEYSGIGIFSKDINGQTFVSGILDGSPAAQSGLKVGDRLLSVDGQPFRPIQSFAGKAGKEVTLLVQRSINPNSQQKISLKPKMLDATTMFMDALNSSIQTIQREGKKIGYVHIWSYAGDQYQQQLEDELIYGRLNDADALVLDLREGWGGAPLTALNIYTGQGPSITNIPRNGQRYIYNSHWKKPVVMLVNEGSRSAKEILAFGFQQYQIGPVVGAKTAGAVVAGSPFLMQDGSLLYLAVANVYVNGKHRLEGEGVTPDVVVPFTLEYAQGADPQKERAIAVALEAAKQQK
jgi:carboxyl-terminal processing protease